LTFYQKLLKFIKRVGKLDTVSNYHLVDVDPPCFKSGITDEMNPALAHLSATVLDRKGLEEDLNNLYKTISRKRILSKVRENTLKI
jgi:hypothetical protein